MRPGDFQAYQPILHSCADYFSYSSWAPVGYVIYFINSFHTLTSLNQGCISLSTACQSNWQHFFPFFLRRAYIMATWIQLNATLLRISSGKSGLQPKVADMVIRTVFLTFYYPHVKKKLHRLSPQDTQGSQDEFNELQQIPDFQQGDGGVCSELKDKAGEMKNLARIGLPLFCLSLPGGATLRKTELPTMPHK